MSIPKLEALLTKRPLHKRAVSQHRTDPSLFEGLSVAKSAAQVTALNAAGCERIFREKASGARWDRPELHRLLDQLRKGDVLVVWKLDRLLVRSGTCSRSWSGTVRHALGSAA